MLEPDTELVGDDLRDAGLVARPRRGDAGEDGDVSVRRDADRRPVVAGEQRGVRQRAALGGELEAEAEADMPTLAARVALFLREAVGADQLAHAPERARVIAAVEHRPRHLGERKLLGPDEIPEPHLDPVDAGRIRDPVHDPVHQEGRGFLSEGAVAVPRALVGDDGEDLDAAIRNLVRGRDAVGRDVRHGPAAERRRHADVGHDADVQRRHTAVGLVGRLKREHLFPRVAAG